jgi:hypothetical protein
MCHAIHHYAIVHTGVERNAIVANDVEKRKKQIPIVQLVRLLRPVVTADSLYGDCRHVCAQKDVLRLP